MAVFKSLLVTVSEAFNLFRPLVGEGGQSLESVMWVIEPGGPMSGGQGESSSVPSLCPEEIVSWSWLQVGEVGWVPQGGISEKSFTAQAVHQSTLGTRRLTAGGKEAGRQRRRWAGVQA